MNAKPYKREIQKSTWYLGRRRDILHMLSEISSLFIGIYAIVLLWGLTALADGPGAYQLFLQQLANPLSLGFHWLALAFAMYNSISWFNLTPKAMPVQLGENFVPGYLIVAAHYVAWACVSLIILFISGVIANG